MQLLEISILKTVAYFDVFTYPLTADEIVDFLDQPAEINSVLLCLDYLVETGCLYRLNQFYSTRNEIQLARRRTAGNTLAISHIEKAKSIAAFLHKIPFIKGIAISGSLSKKYADASSDLDFFIITSTHRLWIVRMLYAVIFKFASLAGKRDLFCLNYFIDEEALEIKEHNVFTATEIITLMPLTGEQLFIKFFDKNSWIYNHLPNGKPDFSYLIPAKKNIFKSFTERLLNITAAARLDAMLHRFFSKRFQRMIAENKQTEKGLTIGAYEASEHACKPLPQYFQPKILQRFNERFMAAMHRYNNCKKEQCINILSNLN
jgi:hypothetical protein